MLYLDHYILKYLNLCRRNSGGASIFNHIHLFYAEKNRITLKTCSFIVPKLAKYSKESHSNLTDEFVL